MSNIQSAQQGAPVAVQPNISNQARAPQQSVKSDAQIVAQVASTEIKASGVNEAAQPTREVVAKAAADLQEFVYLGRCVDRTDLLTCCFDEHLVLKLVVVLALLGGERRFTFSIRHLW